MNDPLDYNTVAADAHIVTLPTIAVQLIREHEKCMGLSFEVLKALVKTAHCTDSKRIIAESYRDM